MAEPAPDTAQPPDLREPRREPIFNLPAIVVAIIALCVVIFLVEFYWLTDDQDYAFLVRAAFIPERYSGQYPIDIYAFTSTVTYSLLHGGWPHLIINMVSLAAFGSPLANRLGAVRFILFWIVASIAAAGLQYVMNIGEGSYLVGASGAISGMMGAAARFGFQIDRSTGRPGFAGPILPVRTVFGSRTVVSFLAIWMAVNLVTGLGSGIPGMDSQIAWEAHIGGFLVGFFGIALFDRRQPAGRRVP